MAGQSAGPILRSIMYAATDPGADGRPTEAFGSTASADQAVGPAMSRLKTYIVEDSQVIRENLVATLEELSPVEVVGTAEDEHTATSWLRQHGARVVLVIVDIFLKGGSGLGVLRAVGAMTASYKMVVLSNYATADMRRRCLELGAHRVFDKSSDIDALIRYCADLSACSPSSSGGAPS